MGNSLELYLPTPHNHLNEPITQWKELSMNKHANHRDYICERDMEYYDPPYGQGLYFGRFSIRNSTYHLVKSLLETWIDSCKHKRWRDRYLYPDAISEKCRNVLTRKLESINNKLLARGRIPVYEGVFGSVLIGSPVWALEALSEATDEWDLDCIDEELAY